MQSRISEQAQDGKLHIRIGMNKNVYAYSTNKTLIEVAALHIGKSISSIYFNVKHKVWVIRCISRKHQAAILECKRGVLVNG